MMEPVGPSSCSLELRLLGAWSLRQHGLEIPLNRRERRMVALLALRGAGPRPWVAGTLWPEATQTRALNSLRASVMRTNRAVLGLLDVGRTEIGLSREISVDVAGLRHRLFAATPEVSLAAAQSLGEPAASVLLPGWYEDWVLDEREHLGRERMTALEDLAMQALRLEQPRVALRIAQMAITMEPLEERAQSLAIRAHLRCGDLPAAILHFRSYRQRLQRELGVEPSLTLYRLVSSGLKLSP